jgi:hypothetical protein
MSLGLAAMRLVGRCSPERIHHSAERRTFFLFLTLIQSL